MGWDFTLGATVKSLKARMRKSATDQGYKIIAEKTVGSSWWRVMEEPNGDRYIALTLISRRQDRDGKWTGYKSIHEDSGPFDLSVPIDFLRLSPRHKLNDFRRAVLLQHESYRNVLETGKIPSGTLPTTVPKDVFSI